MIPWGDSVLKQANDAMSEEQRKHKLGEDEQISEVHNLPERVKRPLVASSPE